MNRRRFLAVTGTTVGLGTAGCLEDFETTTRSTDGQPPLVADRPDAVYVPSHVEGMEMAGTGADGRYRFALTYSYPHRFWRTTGERTNMVEVRDADTVHLMVTAWDAETETVLPASSASVTATMDGETVVASKTLWAMLSQNMGVHFGDNVALDGDGTYEVTVDFGPVGTRLAGDLADGLADSATATISLPFSAATLDGVRYERLDDRKGDRDALDPMAMGQVPSGQAPAESALPGTSLGSGDIGDAHVVATVLESVPAGISSEGRYLAVSPRTRYNRYPLPFTSLTASVSRGSETVFSGGLTDTLHPDLGYHYGTVVDGVEPDDELAVSIETPPQIARHEGYETAFLRPGTVDL